jgi:microcystin-dependent protein
MQTIHGLAAAGVSIGAWGAIALGAVTGASGGGLPQATIQPSLGVNYIVRTGGDFNHLGDIAIFAGNFAPSGWAKANGALLPINDTTDTLFNVIGTTYGGDGQTNFALPDLRGRVPIGTGTGPGLTARELAFTYGDESITLTTAQLPSHAHTQPGGGFTGLAGGGQAVPNVQPSLALNYTITTQGTFPTRGNPSADPEPLLAQVGLTARPTLPKGSAPAQGLILPINTNQAVFSLLGTTYGGDGRVTFALPDARGRAVVGTTDPILVGEVAGTESNVLTVANLPSHAHAMPTGGGTSGAAGGGQAYSNAQPTLSLNYIIATDGFFPSRGEDTSTNDGPFLGEVALFAGNFVPSGWALADGRSLMIRQNMALFSLLGTTYGGDGRSTFFLPDLRGRLAVGEGQGAGLTNWDLGQVRGTDALTLSQAEMPAHDHTVTAVPEPGVVGLVVVGGIAVGARRRRPR